MASISACRNAADLEPTDELALVGTMEGDPFAVADLNSGNVVECPPSGVGDLEDESRARFPARRSALLMVAAISSHSISAAVRWLDEPIGAGFAHVR